MQQWPNGSTATSTTNGKSSSGSHSRLSSGNRTGRQPNLSSGAVEVSEVQHLDDDAWGCSARRRLELVRFFSDPDGNSWVVQENPARS
jgi:hypothetical protein